ncbi:RNAase [bacterium]|nr:RNAase [bacterium]
MHEVLNRNIFFIKEHLGLFKAANNFDIYDPETDRIIMECREEKLGTFTKILRFTDYKKNTPFDITVRTPEGAQVVRISRGVSLFLSNVRIFDEYDQYIGGKFDITDEHGQFLCQLKGKWTGWNFKFISGDSELAHVTKKWAGIGRELLTSADNYVLEIYDSVPQNEQVRQLILASVMCIDMVFKEG